MNKLIKQDGFLTEDGDKFIKPFLDALYTLLDSSEIQKMSETELRVLGSVLGNKIGNVISNRIASKMSEPKVLNKFSAMSDDQFRQYLENKYGPEWQFMSLTEEEFARIPVLSKEEMESLMKEVPVPGPIHGVRFDY